MFQYQLKKIIRKNKIIEQELANALNIEEAKLKNCFWEVLYKIEMKLTNLIYTLN